MKRRICAIRIAYLPLVGSLCFILGFLPESWKDNLLILAIESLFPYQKLILLDFWRDNIMNLVIKVVFSYKRLISKIYEISNGFLFR